jgi:TrmH family RNA methyltransferase
VISSLKNPKVAAAVRLKKRSFRESDERFLVEGPQGVREALASGAGVVALFHSGPPDDLVEAARRGGVEAIHVSEEVMARLTSTVTPQGVVAVVRFVHVGLDALLPDPACVAVLHSVRDPGNAGTVVRSADAAGADAVIFCATSVDAYNPKTVRASAGSLFHLPVVRGPETADAVEALRSRGCRIYAMDAEGDADLYELDLTAPTAFLLGNEAWGLPSEVASLADASVRVPIRGRAESLNLAAAATLCMFELARQHREGRRVALESVIASAAHDIRSPLTAMKGFGYALATRWDHMADEHRTLMLQGIVYDTDRLNMIVRQLVDAARVVGGTLELFPERVDVRALVEKVAQSAARDPDRPPIVWEGSERPMAFLDPDRLQLVLEAFAEAEVWWAGEGPIRVTARRSDGRLLLEAFRAGTQLTDEGAAALFQPRAPGTGAGSKIGLFVAHGVAEAQGGTVGVEVDGGGLRFRLDVPAGDAEQAV